MNIVFGCIMAVIGAYLFFSAVFKCEKFLYKFLAAKSRLLFRGGVHTFYTVVGFVLMTLGILWAKGMIF